MMRGENRARAAPGVLGGHVWVCGDSTAWFNREPVSGDINARDTQGVLCHLNDLLGGILLEVGNSAVSGVRLTEVIGTQVSAIVAAKTTAPVDWVLCSVTANDFYNTSPAVRSFEYVKADACRFLRDMADQNIPVVFLSGIARGAATVGTNVYSAPQEAEQRLFVAWCNLVAPTIFPQHVFVDSHALGLNTDGSVNESMLYDGLHPTTRYARAIARAVHARLAGRVRPAIYPRLLSSSDVAGGASSKNVLASSALGGTIGQTTLLSGWTEAVKTNCTTSYLLKANPYGGAGNQQEVTCTFSAAGQLVLQHVESFTAGSRIGNGAEFYASAIVDAVESTSGLIKDAYVRGSVTDGTATKYGFGAWHRTSDATAGGYFENLQGVVQVSAPNSAPSANVNGATIQLSIRSTGAGQITFRFAEPCIWRR